MATTSSKQTCNCSAKAYPKYSKTPSAVVPMPALSRQPCTDCGAKQVRMALFKLSFSGTLEIHRHHSWTICVCLSLCFPVSHGPLTCRHKSRVSASQSSREEITALLLLWVCQASQNMNSSVWLKCVDQGLIPLLFPITHQVNGATMHFFQSGYFLVSVDACSGKILKKTSFAKMDAKMEQHLKTGLRKRWKSNVCTHTGIRHKNCFSL